MKSIHPDRLPRRRPAKGGSLFGALLVTLASITAANAQTSYTNGSGDGTWDNANNWTAGVPTATGTASVAVFDGAGSTVTNGSADTAFTIQIGQATETTGPAIGAYVLTGGTINMADATGSTIINDVGTADTATQTINSNLVLGTSSDTGVKVWTINDLSGGNLNIGGNISFASTTPATLTTDLNVVVNAGDTVTLSGTNSFVDAAGTATALSLGTTATAAYGNLRITNAAALGSSSAGNREEVFGTSGALQFDTGTGTGTNATQTQFLSLAGSRTSESAPEVENVSGTNTVGEALIRSTGNHYIQSDAGLLTINSVQEDGGPNGVLFLDGSGNGIITGSINNKTQVPTSFSLSVVKDGSGTWTYGTGSSIVGGTADPINTSVAGGTLLVDTTSTTAMATNITVTNSGTGNAVLGGIGHVAGQVILSGGGTINPGDVGAGIAKIGTFTLSNTAGLQVLGSGTLQFDLDSDAGSADLLAITGTLNIGTGITTLSLDDVGNTVLAQGTVFDIASYTNGITGTFANDANGSIIQVGDNFYQLNYGSGTTGDVSLTVVPEPSVWALMGLGLSGLVLVQRKRRVFQS